MGDLLPITAAAAALGIKPSELRISRQKGLPPGNAGKVVAGVLVWDSDDLVPAQKLELDATVPAKATKPELIALARARGIEVPAKVTKPELLALLGA